MNKYALVLSAVILSGFAGKASADEAPVSVSTDTKLEWPDYKSKSWTMVEQSPFVVEVKIPVKNNSYVLGPGRYDVAVGTVTAYLDSAENPSMVVQEGDVLGKGTVVRLLQMRGLGIVSMQLRVGDHWHDIDLSAGARLVVEIMEPEKVISKGELKGVVLKVMDGDKELVKVVVQNNPSAKKSGKK